MDRPTNDEPRYARQALLPQIGVEGQRQLARSTAVVVGCGALGCVSSDLLARAGVGRLILIDRDVVEPSNLHRQTLFTESDAAARAPKAIAARDRLAQVNGSIEIIAHIADLNHTNAERLIAPPASLAADPDPDGSPRLALIDATDNFPTRLLLNDLAVRHGVPLLYAGGVATHASMATILPRHPDRAWGACGATACLRCLMPEPPAPGSVPTCDTAGVLGMATSAIASLQSAEAIKCLLGRWEAVSRSLRSFDLWDNRAASTPIDGDAIDPACPCCAGRTFEFLDGSRASPRGALCGRDAIQVRPDRGATLDLAALAERWNSLPGLYATPYMVRARIDEPVQNGENAGGPGRSVEITAFADGRAIVSGTTDPQRAAAIYARYIGH
ncbi:MAG: ThiF family adenylyltransferase [Phycisphaerales bacterium]